MTGTVKKLVGERAFGFITDPTGTDFFFHSSDCPDDGFAALQEGDAVSFEPEQMPKGPRGRNVRRQQAEAAS